MTEENVVTIGDKDIAVYELRARDIVEAGKDEIIIESTGIFDNGKALDLAEILKRKRGMKIDEIKSDTIEKERNKKNGKVFSRKLTVLKITMLK